MKERQLSTLSKWDQRFVTLAFEIRTWSKDNFKVGCIISKNRRVLTTGYNGFPINFVDSKDRIENKEIKRKFMIHAEENAILNAVRNGIKLKNSTIYISSFPCLDCAKRIVQSGIIKVICFNYDDKDPKLERYNFKDVESLFKECDIELIKIQ